MLESFPVLTCFVLFCFVFLASSDLCFCLACQVFFCGAMEKASELLGEGVAEPMDFSLLVGASSWLVRPFNPFTITGGHS